MIVTKKVLWMKFKTVNKCKYDMEQNSNSDSDIFQRKNLFIIISLIVLLISTWLSACSRSNKEVLIPTSSSKVQTFETSKPTKTFTPEPSATPTTLPSLTPTVTNAPTPVFLEPENCVKPSENYDLVVINGRYLNQRTYSMLENAQSIYQGEIELTGYHLTQGSYTNQISASFGTHNGGGAVDISVIQYGTYQVLYDDIEPLIEALRIAGFAAWLRNFDQLYPGSPIHIHAIAIGDRDLSGPARDQLTGESGYFLGFNGIPQTRGQEPIPDEHGGPIICQWMLEMGYADLRTPTP